MSDAAFQPFRRLCSKTVVLLQEDIDTDQIVPARFMATTDRTGMSEALFHDLRFDGNGRPRGHPLDKIDPNEHRILVVGNNFGCGSSREHAAWALYDFGFRIILSTGFADIFASNAAQNGILTIVVARSVHDQLLAQSGSEVLIDLEANSLTASFLRAPENFSVDPFTRTCLLEGRDSLGWLVSALGAVGIEDMLCNFPMANLSQLFAQTLD